MGLQEDGLNGKNKTGFLFHIFFLAARTEMCLVHFFLHSFFLFISLATACFL